MPLEAHQQDEEVGLAAAIGADVGDLGGAAGAGVGEADFVAEGGLVVADQVGSDVELGLALFAAFLFLGDHKFDRNFDVGVGGVGCG